jgi:TolB-like protein/tetratricopeptide (TPR) repeat protein
MALPLIAELNRRRVFRALVGYGIAAFALLQIIEPVMHGLRWPDAVLSYAVVLLGLGFPVVITLAWIFDVNAGHIERSASPVGTRLPGVKLVLVLVGIGLLAATPGIAWYFVWRGHGTAATGSVGTKAPAVGQPAASIAVLPFVDMSAGKDQEYLSDGIAEEIINSLAQVDQLRVIGRTSSFSFKGKNEDLRGIGERLGAANLLEGSVRKSGARIRVTAQLVESTGGSHLWSQTYDRELTDLFAVQDEIAAAVVSALKVKLLAGRSSGAAAQRPSTAVYNQYLLGKQFVRRSVGNPSPDANGRAIEAFKGALALDDRYAPAWAALALAENAFAQGYANTPAEWKDASERAVVAAERAVSLGPDLADGYEARGWIRTSYKWDWAGARADLERAMALNPGSSSILNNYAHLLWATGRLQESIAVVKKAIEVDPLDPESWWFLGVKTRAAGQYDVSRKAFNRSLEIGPDNGGAISGLGMLSVLEGDPETASTYFQRSSWEEGRLLGTALVEFARGHPTESTKALDVVEKMPLVSFAVARVYAFRGERSRALDWLERAHAERDPGLLSLKLDPLLRKLHGDPRWNALLEKMNLPLD